MASNTYFDTGNRSMLSCTVFDNGDWELFNGTTSIAHEVSPIGAAKARPISREKMRYIAELQFSRFRKGDFNGK